MKFTKKNATAFFALLFGGEHNIPSKVRKYEEGYGVHTAEILSTFDSDLLTRLVTQANENSVRAAIYPHSSTRQLIVVHRLKKRSQVKQQAAKPAQESSVPPAATQSDINLAVHPEAEQIISQLPSSLQGEVRDALKRGLPVFLRGGLPLYMARVNPSLQAMHHNAVGQMNYQHMCEVHPEFATAFKSYLNGMSLDEAVNAAERDLSVPGCLEASLSYIGQYYLSLPEDGRT